METLPVPHPGQLLVLAAPRPFLRQALPILIARLAVPGGLRVLDFGNSFNFHAIARAVRRQTSELHAQLERIHIARAFTCYQVLSLLAQTPADGMPTIGLDLLATFSDENVSLHERRGLLNQSLDHLQRLCRAAPVAVSTTAPPPDQPDEWFDALQERAAQVWRLEDHNPAIQPRLL